MGVSVRVSVCDSDGLCVWLRDCDCEGDDDCVCVLDCDGVPVGDCVDEGVPEIEGVWDVLGDTVLVCVCVTDAVCDCEGVTVWLGVDDRVTLLDWDWLGVSVWLALWV